MEHGVGDERVVGGIWVRGLFGMGRRQCGERVGGVQGQAM